MGVYKKLFIDGWEFYRTDLSASFEEIRAAENCFQPVEIPHDWLIYDVKNLYRDGCGWYRKKFGLSEKRGPVLLRFEGVYMDSTVYVNGRKTADWKYGYSTFDVDITEAAEVGENEIIVQVRFQAPNSRWYSGAGIYRKVWIKLCDKAYLPLDGTYVSVRPCAEGNTTDFLLEAETETAGKTKDCFLRYSLWKDREKLEDLAVIPCGESLRRKVERPLLWDVEDPQCYELRVELCGQSETGEEILWDDDRITIGFRTLSFHPEKGCFLNGRPIKIHGVCEHHDLGCLGAAFHPSAVERKLKILKAMGVNAVRTSHNMQAPEFLELADRDRKSVV